MHPIWFSIGAAVVMLMIASAPAAAQWIAPAGVTVSASVVPSRESPGTTLRLGRQALNVSDAPNRERNIVIGALIGAGAGVALGYGLAFLGRAAYCEGQAQCAEYPRRAIKESTRAGFLIGGSIGALIGWAMD